MKYNIEEVFIDGDIIGYTDFTKIYINKKITGLYLDVLRVHECSHIWLRHKTRAKNIDNLNMKLWNIACDMEIAKHIYSDNDENIIISPRSPLKDGILKKHCEPYKGCEYAEDFYCELLKKRNEDIEKLLINWGDIKIGDEPGDEPGDENINIEECIKEIKDHISKQILQKLYTKQQELLNDFKAPKPSIASEIDALRRSRSLISRNKTYARPNKRDDSDFIKKGFKLKLKNANITIYVDRSGSFSYDKTLAVNDKLKSILKKYRGRINSDCIYFNDILRIEDPINGGGGTNYSCVVEHINTSSSTLSIIITDDDPCSEIYPLPKKNILVVPIGCTHTNIGRALSVKEIAI